ncbi:hypothetical protein [Emticicia agri]|uniref:Peptidase S74 domain-containing protein n=1 Tax=Emticicia agri TaxID=2492393 RepID=A0A4V1ZD78_9BACT|nr:hypothetical protein [Emticicia agri]RYU95210.1 hypothetical protein EWM59_13250 [Emticicia agri]
MKNIIVLTLFILSVTNTMAQIIETPANSILAVKSGITIPDTSSYRINGSSILKTKNTSNVILGFNAANTIITGQNNVFLGSNSNGTTSAISNSVAVGVNAKVAINNAIVLGDTANTNIKVGIGTAAPRYPLDVKGVVNMRIGLNSPSLKINDREFLALDADGSFLLSDFRIKYNHEREWSDKVFESNYQLMPIGEVMNFARVHKRLPNVPSAKEVVEKGVEMNTIIAKLLEKVEELTIYTANQAEEISLLKGKLAALEDKSNKK